MCHYVDNSCDESLLKLNFWDDFPGWLHMTYTHFYSIFGGFIMDKWEKWKTIASVRWTFWWNHETPTTECTFIDLALKFPVLLIICFVHNPLKKIGYKFFHNHCLPQMLLLPQNEGIHIDKMKNMGTVQREICVSFVIKMSYTTSCTNPSFVWVMLKNMEGSSKVNLGGG